MEDKKSIESLVVATLKKDGEKGSGERAILEFVPQNGRYILRRFDTEQEVLNSGVSSCFVAVEISEIPDEFLTQDEILTGMIYRRRLTAIQEKLNSVDQNSCVKKPYVK